MRILVVFGPIIGAVIIFLFSIINGLHLYLKGKKKANMSSGRKIIYVSLLFGEVVLILITIFVPKITGTTYLIDGLSMTNCGYTTITPNNFKIAYQTSNRSYSNRIHLSADELNDVRVTCSSDEGTVSLIIKQDNTKISQDITNSNELLDLSMFTEGDISFSLQNKEAKNVHFELIW